MEGALAPSQTGGAGSTFLKAVFRQHTDRWAGTSIRFKIFDQWNASNILSNTYCDRSNMIIFWKCSSLLVHLIITVLYTIFLVPCYCTLLLQNREWHLSSPNIQNLQKLTRYSEIKNQKSLDVILESRRHVNLVIRAVRFRRIRGGFCKCFGSRREGFIQPSSAITTNIPVSEITQRPAETQMLSEPVMNGVGELNQRRDSNAMPIDPAPPLPYSIQSSLTEVEDSIAREGWLFKKDHGLLSAWRRRYVTLRHGCLTYYQAGEEWGGDAGRDIPLLHCTVVEKEDRDWLFGVRCAFAITVSSRPGSAPRSYVFAASDALDRSSWVRPVPLPLLSSSLYLPVLPCEPLLSCRTPPRSSYLHL
jgi:hypothetical protein